MDESSSVFVGIDVSKDRLDVHLRLTGKAFCVSRDGKGLDDLIRRLIELPVALVVLDATGGFETTRSNPFASGIFLEASPTQSGASLTSQAKGNCCARLASWVYYLIGRNMLVRRSCFMEHID
jgi:hypothetical protein